MKLFRCAAILFDLDGVLVDSTHSVTRQWRLWASENGLDTEKLVELAHGRRTIEVVRSLAPQLDATGEAKKIEAREAADTDGVNVMPGAAEFVSAIPDGHWCVVTSGTRYLATSRLRHAHLPIPKVLVSADDVVQGKPDPEPYLRGAQLLGVNPAECLVIEDAPAGIQAAHAAAMKVLALQSTYPACKLEQADAVVPSLTKLRLRHDGAGGTRVLEISFDDRS